MRYNVISKKKLTDFLTEARRHPSFVIDEVARTLNMDRDEAVSIFIYLVKDKQLNVSCTWVHSKEEKDEIGLCELGIF